MLTWREFLESDMPACFRLQPEALASEIAGRERALKVWKDLLRSPAFVARTIEDDGRVIGFGSSVFVLPEFADNELADPRPHINSRIIASVVSRRSVVLSYDQVARANAQAGISTVFLSTVWWKTSTPAEFAEMMRVSAGSCAEAHAGYRLRKMLVELPLEFARQLLETHAGGIAIVREFPEIGRALAVFTKEASDRVTASVVSTIFHYVEPVLGFASRDQALLGVAVRGATDQEIAARLEISVAWVKKRWLFIFERIQDRKPGLFANLEVGSDGKRGPQRRHRVLSYIREHPEELRPYLPARREI